MQERDAMQKERIGDKSAHGNARLLTKLLTQKKVSMRAGLFHLQSPPCRKILAQPPFGTQPCSEHILTEAPRPPLAKFCELWACGSQRSKGFSTTSTAGTLDEFQMHSCASTTYVVGDFRRLCHAMQAYIQDYQSVFKRDVINSLPEQHFQVVGLQAFVLVLVLRLSRFVVTISLVQ